MTVYKKESILSQRKLLSNVVVDKIANECNVNLGGLQRNSSRSSLFETIIRFCINSHFFRSLLCCRYLVLDVADSPTENIITHFPKVFSCYVLICYASSTL